MVTSIGKMKTSSINLHKLQAVALMVSTEETRYYLNGVKLEISRRSVAMIATDGHRAMALCDELADDAPDNTLLGECVIPFQACKAFKIKTGRFIAHQYVTLSGDITPGKDCTLATDGSPHGFKTIDGTFPDWRRIVPSKCDEAKQDVLGFNWTYVQSFERAAKIADLGGVTMEPNGTGPAMLRFSNDPSALGVLMPIRAAVSGYGRPAWIDAKSEDHKAAA